MSREVAILKNEIEQRGGGTMLRNAKFLAAVIFCCFLSFSASARGLMAQDHVVPTANLHQVMMSSSAARQNNLRKVERFLSSQQVRSAVKKSGFNLKEVRQAVPSLNDQELARLARTTDKIQSNFAAGALTRKQLTLIIVAGIIVVVILALKA
jgi:hypothetical protein